MQIPHSGSFLFTFTLHPLPSQCWEPRDIQTLYRYTDNPYRATIVTESTSQLPVSGASPVKEFRRRPNFLNSLIVSRRKNWVSLKQNFNKYKKCCMVKRKSNIMTVDPICHRLHLYKAQTGLDPLGGNTLHR